MTAIAESARRPPPALWQKFRRTLDYMRRFGVLRGLRTRFVLAAGRGEATVEIPQVAHPLAVRRNTTDHTVFEQVFLRDLYEIPLDFEPRFIVDGGANVGYTTAYFASKYPAAQIVAVEPEPGNAAMLRRNVAAYQNVTVVEAAIWHTAEPLEIANPDAGNWGFQMRGATTLDAPTVQAVTIGDLLEKNGAEIIDILKLDIEGAEGEVFARGSDAWIDRFRIAIVEVHREELAPGAAATFEAAIADHDFDIVKHDEHVILVSPLATRAGRRA